MYQAFNSSHLDGYALRSVDTLEATLQHSVVLTVRGSNMLRVKPLEMIQASEAYHVRAGGYLPEGCDAVVGKEEIHVEGDKLFVTRPIEPVQQLLGRALMWPKVWSFLRLGINSELRIWVC